VNPPAVPILAPIRRPGIRAWINASHPCADALTDAIESIVAVPPSFTPIPTRSHSRRAWAGHLDGIPFPVVIKQGWVNPTYPLDRRIARRVSLIFHAPFRCALETSLRLSAVGFPAAHPILCWKKFHGLFPVEEGILYPEIDASGSLRRYLHNPDTGNPYDRRLRLPHPTLAALGRFLRTLNAAGFVHIDPTPQNILLRPGAADPPTESDFTLIDVESFQPLPDSSDLPHLRRIRARAIAPLLPYIPSDDLPLFATHFVLPSESPADWLPILQLLHRHPGLHPPARLALHHLSRTF
jgi:hypothetical protein